MKFILDAIKSYVKEEAAGLMEIWKWIEDQERSPKMDGAEDLARLFMRAYEKENGSEGDEEKGPAAKIPRIH
ncbi:hypothetical protein B9Z55_016056 [Caenorhabditis nigoni]|uniref:Uncharacterized protein n=1 Tax=Caenorhabditis nigoni TaxID=1611254 RepID=A0A2G5UDJ7_9PELO|nr:hypothetical protein B9Z55_016056 [Caenorhabditis nigoni]